MDCFVSVGKQDANHQVLQHCMMWHMGARQCRATSSMYPGCVLLASVTRSGDEHRRVWIRA